MSTGSAGTSTVSTTDHKNTGDHSASTLEQLNNRYNFEKSGTPARILFFSNREWNDFAGTVLESMRRGFAARRPAVEVDVAGTRYLVDFIRMLQIDLSRGTHVSIAWIDDSGRCFFPLKVVVAVGDAAADAAPPAVPPPRRTLGRPPKVPIRKVDGYVNAVKVLGEGPPPPILQPVLLGRNPAADPSVPGAAAAATKTALRINRNPYHIHSRVTRMNRF